MNVPFLSFDYINSTIGQEIKNAFNEFLECGKYILGPKLKEFEKKYASFNQVNYSVGVSNGLDALNLALRTLEINGQDEVIVPSNTFIATILAIVHNGAKPIFVEPSKNSYNIDIERIEQAISSKTKAIIPVHLFGNPCEMDEIMALSQKYNLKIIEDNAQAQGAKYKGQLTGSFGHINAVSFYPGKNLGALGDAGGLTTDSKEYYTKLQELRNYGSSKKYYNDSLGYNNRLDELQASILSIKLKYLNEWNLIRNQLADRYHSELNSIEKITLPIIRTYASHVFHQYVILTTQRDQLQNYLSDKGIRTLIHYPIPPHLQKCMKFLNYTKGDFPIAEELSLQSLSLPIYPGLTSNQQSYVIEQIKEFYSNV